jgi:hypothetical protein
MADNDARRVIVVQADKDGYATALSINEALRQLVEMIYQQEGRRGEITLRDDVLIDAPNRKTVLHLSGQGSVAQGSLGFTGTNDSSLFIAKGAWRNDSGVWIATDTTAQIIELTRDATTPRIYGNSGLTVGGAFNPILLGRINVV